MRQGTSTSAVPAAARDEHEAEERAGDEERAFVLRQQRSAEADDGDRERPAVAGDEPPPSGGDPNGEDERQWDVGVGSEQLVEDGRRQRDREQRRPQRDRGNPIP